MKSLLGNIVGDTVEDKVEDVAREVGLIDLIDFKQDQAAELLATLKSLQDDTGCLCSGPRECTDACIEAQRVIKQYKGN